MIEPSGTDGLQIQLPGLSELDRHELEQVFVGEPMQVLKSQPPGLAHGQLDTATVIVTVTPQVMSLLALWMLKSRRRGRVRRRVVVVDGGGRRYEEDLDFEVVESESAQADVLQRLEAVLASPGASALSGS